MKSVSRRQDVRDAEDDIRDCAVGRGGRINARTEKDDANSSRMDFSRFKRVTGSPPPIPAWALQMDSSRCAHHLSNIRNSLSKASANASSVRVLPFLCRLGVG